MKKHWVCTSIKNHKTGETCGIALVSIKTTEGRKPGPCFVCPECDRFPTKVKA